MKIALTGAAGHLGKTLCRMLSEAGGYEIIAVDIKKADEYKGISEIRTADLSKKEEALRAIRGAEAIIHCASVHPFHKYSDEQYLDLNIKGTWNLYSAASELGIKKVVMTSSIMAAGLIFPPEKWPVTEEMRQDPADIYSYTKFAQEVAAKCFADSKGVQSIILRPCSFMEREPVRQALSLLGNHMYVEDIASAHIAALNATVSSLFEVFFISNSLPYSAKDKDIADDRWKLAERYYPGVKEWFNKKGYESFYLGTVYSIQKAKELLGWEPLYNFEWAFEKAKQNG